MALGKIYTQQVEVTDDDHVRVRLKTSIVEYTGDIEDGEVISSSYHRTMVRPGDDYSAETGKVRRVCEVAHVPTAVAQYQAKIAADKAVRELQVEDIAKNRKAEKDAKKAAKDARKAHKAFLDSEG